MEGHFSPEMMQQQGQMMFQGMPGMSGPGQMPQMPYANMEQLQNQVAQVPMGNQAQGHPHPSYAMQGMGMQGMAQGMAQGMHMPQGMGQGMQAMPQGMGQGMPQGMSPGMSPDGSMVPFQMDNQAAQAAQAAQQGQMMSHGGAGGGAAGGCPCQGNPCGGCPSVNSQAGCGGNCGGYVYQPMPNMMIPQNMMQGQMAGVAGQASAGQGCGQQQQPQQQQHQQQQQQQFHPNMQVFMVPGAGGQMQPSMASMQMQGQMQMHGMQGQMPHMPGHMPDGHGHGNQGGAPGEGQAQGGEGGDGDAKGGPGRMAAGRRATQPKQGGASWGASRGRDMRGPDSEVPAVPGEQSKGGNQPAPAQDGGQKGMRKPKNPWADIQDSGGLDQETAQMWAIGQMPSDNQQKSGFGKGNKGKKEGKNDGKAGDDLGGKAGGKDMPQQKWVEVQKNNNNNMGKGANRGIRQDQWQPKESPKLQEAVPMSMPTPGKGKAPPIYNPGGSPTSQASAKKKGGRRDPPKDPKMDDWLSARFNGQPPATPTGSMGFGDDSEWHGESGYEDSDRPKRKGGKGGKGGAGKGDRKGGNGSAGKGKAKGGRGSNGGNYWRGA